jgi:hypothetical protein
VLTGMMPWSSYAILDRNAQVGSVLFLSVIWVHFCVESFGAVCGTVARLSTLGCQPALAPGVGSGFKEGYVLTGTMPCCSPARHSSCVSACCFMLLQAQLQLVDSRLLAQELSESPPVLLHRRAGHAWHDCLQLPVHLSPIINPNMFQTLDICCCSILLAC